MKKTITLYHGSGEIIETPRYGVGNPHNDYGLGFYCTEDIELAKEWACGEESGGYANKYSLDASSLSVLDLSDEKFCILHWLSVLLKNRVFSLSSEIERDARDYILENFPVDTEKYDVIKGYRADDAYFAYAHDFIRNAVTVEKLSRAVRAGNPGEQTVLKSERSFGCVRFLGYETAPGETYYERRKKRDSSARETYLNDIRTGPLSYGGFFVADIIREGIKADDTRLR